MTLAQKASLIRVLLFDVDGVLTDGRILLHGDGTEAKSFDIKDGAALVWARSEGLKTGVLSARPSAATERRAGQLQLDIVVQSSSGKLRSYEQILKRHRLRDEEVAYMGDDLLDLPVLGRAGLSAAPADAAPEVRARVDYVALAGGGRGAVREVVELVLKAQGRWEGIVERWLAGAAR